MKSVLILLIRVYRGAVAPFFGPCCRFYPSCSSYAEEAIRRKGVFAGTGATLKRLLKCHPFHPGGIDPVKT